MPVGVAGADARAISEGPGSERDHADSAAMTKTLRPRGTAFSTS